MLNCEINSMNYVNALKIKERVKLYEKHDIYNTDYDDYQRWVNTRGVVTEGDIKRMLEIEDLSGEEFNNALKELSENENMVIAKEVEQENWFKEYQKIIDEYDEVSQKVEYDSNKIDLGVSIAPFLLRINRQLYAVKSKLKLVKINDKVLESMGAKSANVLLELIIKTFVWGFRSSTENRQERENGTENTDELLKEYLIKKFYSAKDLVEFYDQYPVCARRVTNKTIELTRHFTELLQRLDCHFEDIAKNLELNDISELLDIDAAQGDTHEQGRFVVKLKFKSEIVIYKPKNLQIEKTFFDTISEFCEKHGLLDLYRNKYYLDDEFTFEKFVKYETCTKQEQLERYYRRFGQLCAFVFVFRGNDIHFENIIAHNEYPVIIDMETLFQHLQDVLAFSQDAFIKVYLESMNSICGTALLPLISFTGGKEGKGIDISALNGSGANLPYKVLQLVSEKSDNMHFEYAEAKVANKNNLPKLNGKRVDFLDYYRDIIDGFEKTMNEIANNKEYFVGENGILKRFQGLKARQLMRATSSYAKMMSFSSHPNYSTDMRKLERMFCNIWNYGFRDKRVISAETSDMVNGDIPIFYEIVDECALITSRGERLDNYFERSGYDKVKHYISCLDKHEIDKQVSQAKVSMGLFEELNAVVRSNHSLSHEEFACILKDEERQVVLERVYEIADCIVSNAVIEDTTKTIDWANVSFDENHKIWKIASITHNFSRGSAGLLLFLSRLGKWTRKYQDYVNLIITSYIDQPLNYLQLGVKDGVTGILFTFLSVYRETRDTCYKELAYNMQKEIEERVKDVINITYENGLLGIINTYIEAYHLFGDEKILHKTSEFIEMYQTLLKDELSKNLLRKQSELV